MVRFLIVGLADADREVESSSEKGPSSLAAPTIGRRFPFARSETTPGESVAKQEFYLGIDAAQLRLRQALQLQPYSRIEAKEERLLVRHQLPRSRPPEAQVPGEYPDPDGDREGSEKRIDGARGEHGRLACIRVDDRPVQPGDEHREHA